MRGKLKNLENRLGFILFNAIIAVHCSCSLKVNDTVTPGLPSTKTSTLLKVSGSLKTITQCGGSGSTDNRCESETRDDTLPFINVASGNYTKWRGITDS